MLSFVVQAEVVVCRPVCFAPQIEVRVLAHMSNDTALCQLFHKAGSDVYKTMASHVFGVHPDLVSDAQRRQAKTVRVTSPFPFLQGCIAHLPSLLCRFVWA